MWEGPPGLAAHAAHLGTQRKNTTHGIREDEGEPIHEADDDFLLIVDGCGSEEYPSTDQIVHQIVHVLADGACTAIHI